MLFEIHNTQVKQRYLRFFAMAISIWQKDISVYTNKY